MYIPVKLANRALNKITVKIFVIFCKRIGFGAYSLQLPMFWIVNLKHRFMHYTLNMGFVMQDQRVYSGEHEICVKLMLLQLWWNAVVDKLLSEYKKNYVWKTPFYCNGAWNWTIKDKTVNSYFLNTSAPFRAIKSILSLLCTAQNSVRHFFILLYISATYIVVLLWIEVYLPDMDFPLAFRLPWLPTQIIPLT